ncbi:SDR family oxidoreductase [Eupransor demetentiae]|uniref:Contains NAD(P)-binding and DUF2867 domains (YbjT) n=1 Tax=Eupransor demetentiae TaxID=3109584 RepID=A0ABM9N411_9LACO|nr:Uncharacterized conserved protein YbjT [Lactobacillaceae bacterium LMG 33000]
MSEKVLVIGAHGKVGRIIVQQLGEAGKQVFAGFRTEDQFGGVTGQKNVTPILFNLQMLKEEMVKIFKKNNFDAIIFSAGAGGASDALTTQIDLDGAIKTMDAAEEAGIKRYLMVSAAGADIRDVWVGSGIYTYFMMKHYADRILKDSDLDYTIVRPSTLSDEAGKGTVKNNFVFGQDASSISREDVATFVTTALDAKTAYRKIYAITAGDEPIQEIFN